MAKITVGTDCGNSPKRIFLKDLNIAFAEGDNAFIADSVTDDILWNMVGGQQVQGKQTFIAALGQMSNSKVAELIIDKIVTHGREGAANGEIIMESGERYAFCDVYEFKGAKGAKVKSITSYMIELTEGG